jgi:hypothetical protein
MRLGVWLQFNKGMEPGHNRSLQAQRKEPYSAAPAVTEGWVDSYLCKLKKDGAQGTYFQSTLCNDFSYVVIRKWHRIFHYISIIKNAKIRVYN